MNTSLMKRSIPVLVILSLLFVMAAPTFAAESSPQDWIRCVDDVRSEDWGFVVVYAVTLALALLL